MKFQDYYKVLGISREATAKEIQRSYRKLARKYHPDLNKEKGAEEKFKEINEAYEVLRDQEKRNLYNTYGENWKHAADQAQHGHPHGFTDPPRHEGFSRTFHFDTGDDLGESKDFSDILNNLFGDASSHGSYSRMNSFDRPGRSHEADITVSLADVYHGATKSISLESVDVDERGQVHPSARTFKVKIPKGVTDGAVMRLAGQGEKGMGKGMAGDILLKIHIAPDPRFLVDGIDLHTTVPISPWEAALGTKLEVHTMDGVVTLTTPKGVQNGKKLRLKNKGIQKNRDETGAIIVHLEIRMPDQISPEEERLFRELMQKSSFNPRVEQQQHACK